MKTYPYNKESAEGRRLFKLLGVQFNPGVLDVTSKGKSFDTYDVPSVMQCRANRASFLFPSNLSGIKRPQVRIESDVEMAWGDFAEGITTLDFTNDGQELPLSYTQPIEDDTMKLLIDAGLYRDAQFEALMSKLMSDEMFDAESDMRVSHLDVGTNGKQVPVLMVDPVSVVHNDHDPSERTTIADLVKRSAMLAIELRKEGLNSESFIDAPEPEQDREVFIMDHFRDVVQEREEAEVERAADIDSGFRESSPLLDVEIDVTEKLKGTLGFDQTSEDDRIRDLKERDRFHDDTVESDADFEPLPDLDDEFPEEIQESDVSDSFGDGFDDISDIEDPDEEEDELER